MKKVLPILFFLAVGILNAQLIVTSCSPDSGYQGASVSVNINGSGFVITPTADFGTGITVSSMSYILPSLIRADIDIDSLAPIGLRDVVVTNPSGAADTIVGGFRVLLGDSLPPAVTLLFPFCGETLACNDSAIIIALSDPHGIDSASITISINGTYYDLTSPELSLLYDTLLIFTPSTPFSSRIITVQLISVSDTIGRSYDSPPIDCAFYIDTLGPELDEPWPPPYGSTRELEPIIVMGLHDDFSGLDTSSIWVSIDGTHYLWGDPSLDFDGDTLKWSARLAGLDFSDGDTIHICVYANDMTFDCGGPNPIWGPDSGYYVDADSVCWFFRLVVPPPLDINLRIDHINPEQFPFVQAYCEVSDEEGRTIEHLNENNFKVWEMEGSYLREYPLIIHSLGGGGIADIVFAIDVTGSMGGLIDSVRYWVSAFAESLAVSSINYRLGMVTFRDDVIFPFGYDLTGDVATFGSWVSTLTASGGGDGPEVGLDATYDALDSLHFRPGSRIVVILITDNRSHYMGDGTTYSDVTYGMVLSHLTSDGAIFFLIHNTHWMPIPDTLYTGLCDGTGGAWFPASNFAVILDSIAQNIRGGYYVGWTTHNPQPDCRLRDVKILAAYPNIFATSDTLYIEDEDELNYWAPCPPEAIIQEPLPGKFTSCSDQPIIISLAALEDSLSDWDSGIDTSSIQLIVNGKLYGITSPELSYDTTTKILRFDLMPPDTWSHRDDIFVNLAQVLDEQGQLPLHGPLIWHFYVDLVGPIASNPQPLPGASIFGHQPQISFDIEDDFAGIWDESILVSVENREIRSRWPPDPLILAINSPGVTWDGRTFSFDPSAVDLEFMDRDTVCVKIIRAADRIDYCEPNPLDPTGLTDWCFFIPDDDSLCPEFSEFYPESTTTLTPLAPFDIRVTITDPSDVYDDNTGSDGYGVYLWWDDDGSVLDGSYHEVLLSSTDGTHFTTDTPIPGQDETSGFVFRVWAYDDDYDQEEDADRSGCFSDPVHLHFGQGPIATILEPFEHTVTTVPLQPIIVRIQDLGAGVDSMNTHLVVNGSDYSGASPELSFYPPDSLVFIPSAPYPDGDSVDVQLAAAPDMAGNALQNPLSWTFFVDLTPPYIVSGSVHPVDGAIVMDYQQDITMEIEDAYRAVDDTTIVLQVGDTVFSWGCPAIHRDDASGVLTFVPDDIGFSYPNGDTICVELLHCKDEVPDYGEPNDADPTAFTWCFIVSVTSCSHYPDPFTPNGDGINDIVIFSYPYQSFGRGIIYVFDLYNAEVWHSERGATIWDGTTNSGRPATGGIYVYMIDVDGESVCSGSVTLMR